ncbi:MAG TPA: hypothetical protein VLJ42_08305 [Solirubrobacteraceae bacterium]|nr:hypothetical protein [Solirubrobacteraceae bacterium]
MLGKLIRSTVAIAMTGALLALAPAALAFPAHADFGIAGFDGIVLDQNGIATTQAGSHPYVVTTHFELNTEAFPGGGSGSSSELPAENAKDIYIELSPGLIGDPNTTPLCSQQQLLGDGCPPSDAVGTINFTLSLGGSAYTQGAVVYNMVRAPGVPGSYGIRLPGLPSPIYINAGIRTGGDYGLTVKMENIPSSVGLIGADLALWGVPADPSHDAERGGPSTATSRPFLTLPTSCIGPVVSTLRTDSWQHPGDFKVATFVTHNNAGVPVGASGCNFVDFSPGFGVVPDSTTADAPDGFSVGVGIPQNGIPNQLVEADLKKVELTLPQGVALSPAGLAGLQGCPRAQFGYDSPALPTCPDASKVANVQIDTPLFLTPMFGAAYLAQQTDNPFGAPLVLYAYAIGPTGVIEKFAGPVTIDPTTGRLTLTIDNSPQLPFLTFKLGFFGGPRALLTNPPVCGLYTSNARLSPWSGTPPVNLTSSFPVISSCTNWASFAPSFSAGTTNNRAGAASPLSITLSRSDQSQLIAGFSVQTPPGLTGLPGHVPLCPEPQASQGSCDPASAIGHVTLGAGAGSAPAYLGGTVSLTGPYKGAPFGLSIMVPGQIGPLNAGNLVMRAAVAVDPRTSGLVIVSDPLPQQAGGIALQLRTLNITLDRASVLQNPTDCSPLAITGTAVSAQGVSAPLASRYQASDCSALSFKPKLTAATTYSHTSASLRTDLVTPAGGTNVKTLKMTLPKQLAPRAATLRHACPAATFAANPAACKSTAIVGLGTATTPVLPVPIVGPAYLVAHGSSTPDINVLLQGYGVKLILTGTLSIKNGVTTVAFPSLPDVPTPTFDLSLPKGPNALLAGNGTICSAKTITVAAALTAQNAAVAKSSASLKRSGCGKPKVKTKAKKAKKSGKAKKAARHG